MNYLTNNPFPAEDTNPQGSVMLPPGSGATEEPGIPDQILQPKRRLGKPSRLIIPSMVTLLIGAACAQGQGCGTNLVTWGPGWTPTAASDGVVYVGTRQDEVLALNANENGALRPEEQVLWRFTPELTERQGVFGPPTVGEQLVYVGFKGDGDGKNGILYALNKARESSDRLQTDKGEWSKPILGAIVGGPALSQSHGLVLVGSDDGNLYAFRTTGDRPGKMAWIFPTQGKIWSSPVVGDGVVYFGSMDNHVYAVSLEEGLSQPERLLWKYKTGGAVVATPLLVDDMLIVGTFGKKVFALKANTSNPEGELVWFKPFEGDAWFWAGVVSDGESIFVSSMSGTVYALDKQGIPIWPSPFNAESPIVSSPVVVGEELVVATDAGKLFLLSTSSGNSIEVFKDLGKRVKAPLSKDGSMVFVGTEDSTVRGIDVEKWVEIWKVSTER